jgi:hypothetical protein
MRLTLILTGALALAACEAPRGTPSSSPSAERPPRDVDNPHRGA